MIYLKHFLVISDFHAIRVCRYLELKNVEKSLSTVMCHHIISNESVYQSNSDQETYRPKKSGLNNEEWEGY